MEPDKFVFEKEILVLFFNPNKTETVFFGGTENILYMLDYQSTEISEVDEFEDSVLHINSCAGCILVVSSFKEIRAYSCKESKTNIPSLVASFVFDEDIEWTQTTQTKVVSGHKNSTISIIDLETAETTFLYGSGSMHVGCVIENIKKEFSVLSVNTENTLFYWSGKSLTTTTKHKDPKTRKIICLNKQKDGLIAVLGFENGTVSLFHLEKNKIIQELEKHSGSIECVFFKAFAQKQFCISCCLDGEIKLFCLNIKLPTKTVKLESGVSVCSSNNEEDLFYAGCVDGSVYQIKCTDCSAMKIREGCGKPVLCIENKDGNVWIGTEKIEIIEVNK